jgi:DNA-binding CsgD family transcriptional regulator
VVPADIGAPRSESVGRGAAGPSLLERDAELELVREHVDATRGRPGALVLEGEPGIGKTALWRAGVQYARERGLCILSSSPAGGEMQLSFSALGDLFGAVWPMLAELPAPQRRALEVALLLDEAGDEAPEERTIAAATLSALRSLAARGEVLLAIDDVQWLDGPSAAALGFAVRRLGESPVSLLLGRRVGHPPAEARPLEEALAWRGMGSIRLGPLSPSAVRHLIGDRLDVSLPQSVLQRVHETSGGNPFYALELAHALGRRAEPFDHSGGLPVPDTLQGLVREHLGDLPDETKELLGVVAALSYPTLALVEAAGAADAVDDAIRAGVLTAGGDRLRFTHPLLASGAYALLGPRARRDLHRRLAGIVGEGEERARHLALGADGPSAEVSSVLHEAAREAASRGAIGTAADLAELAVRLTPEHLVDEMAVRKLDAASYLVRGGDADRARAHLEPLLAGMVPSPVRAAALLRLARLREESPAHSLELCEQAIGEAHTRQLRAEAHQLAAEMSMLSGAIPRALEHARTAAELAQQAGDTAILVESLGTLCHYETYTGAITPGLLERAVELERTVPRPSNNYSPREIFGLRLMYGDRLDDARAQLEESLAAATELGDELDRFALLVHLTQLECRAGRLARANEHAREGYLAQEAVGSWAPAASRFVTALAAAHLGRVSEARAAGEQGVAVSEASGTALFRVLCLWALGFLELSLGDGAAANRRLRDLPEELEAMGYANPGVRPVYADAIEARIAVGDLDVEPLVDRLEIRGRELDYPWALAAAARCRGLLLAARGDPDAAIVELERGLHEHERSPQPLERGRTLLALGATQRRARHRGRARQTLTEALELFDSLGAPLWAEKATAELARFGSRGRSAGELTRTERRVAELVAQGLSNKEVASALYVTVRTVEAHLSKAYAKLGVRSRAELARRLPRPADE